MVEHEQHAARLGSTFASILMALSLNLTNANVAFADSAGARLADDSLLVLLAPHTDRVQVKADLLKIAQATTIDDMHVDADDYSILQLQPVSGARESTFEKINSIMTSHPEYLAVSRNYEEQEASSNSVSTPSDPDFQTQWPLANMRWNAAFNKYANEQPQSAHLTILTSGCTTVATNNELGAYITEYNATASPVVRESILPGTAEGDIDCSITGCLTGNDTLIAGSASFRPAKPCYITLLRILKPGVPTASDAWIFRALVWSINHQKLRGGPGAISLSFSTNQPGVPPFYANKHLRKLAETLVEHGDILVLAAGDKAFYQNQYTDLGRIVVVQATNMNNNLDSFHVSILNDPYGAPGAVQPAIINGVYSDNNDGSSFSAPLWASAIAMVISMKPSLNAVQANEIILKTGTQTIGSSWKAVIPAFDRAIEAARAALP